MTIAQAIKLVFCDDVRSVETSGKDLVVILKLPKNEGVKFDDLARLSVMIDLQDIDIRSESSYYGVPFTIVVLRDMAERFTEEQA